MSLPEVKPKLFWGSVAAISFGLFAWFFAGVFVPGNLLFTTDDNIGSVAEWIRVTPGGFVGYWHDSTLLGTPSKILLNWVGLNYWFLSPRLFVNVIHGIDLAMGGCFLAAFLYARRLRVAAVVLAMLSVYWLGVNFTITYAGHTGKFGVMMFSALTLWCIEKSVSTGRWGWTLLTGGAAGGMLLEQQDVAVFVGIVIGAYALFAIGRQNGWNVRALIGRLLPMGLVAGFVAGSTMLAVYSANVPNVVSMSEENPQAKWEFVTQWSQPPDETVEFIAPGYMGWRSGEPEGPYWGRSGRSAGWEQTRQGFMNFRLESLYIGAIPVCFALFAVAAAVAGRRGDYGLQTTDYSQQSGRTTEQQSDKTASKPSGILQPSTINHQPFFPNHSLSSDRRAEILFWGAAAAVTLMLAWGKFFPLYALFYKLPVVNNIRNPAKFLQVFQLALGILAAYGLDIALRWRHMGKNSAREDARPPMMRKSPCFRGGRASPRAGNEARATFSTGCQAPGLARTRATRQSRGGDCCSSRCPQRHPCGVPVRTPATTFLDR